MKSCSKCKETKELGGFRPNKQGKLGRHSVCKTCESIGKKKYYKNNRHRIIENTTNYQKTPKGREVRRKALTKWRIANKDLHNFHSTKYKLQKTQACPDWLTPEQIAEIKEIYISKPDGYHVDHIIPLQGKTVSGLHVPWNLQHLPAEENLSKSNKFSQ